MAVDRTNRSNLGATDTKQDMVGTSAVCARGAASWAACAETVANNALLTRLDGKQERMAQHRGEVIFVHFWATWCRPCVQEIALLQRLHEQFRAQKFVLLAVSLDARKKDLILFFLQA